jgi:hypothetical protein
MLGNLKRAEWKKFSESKQELLRGDCLEYFRALMFPDSVRLSFRLSAGWKK